MITKELVNQVFEYLKSDIKKLLSRGKIDKCYSLVDCFARVAEYTNDRMRDEDIENAIVDISNKYFSVTKINPKTKLAVFYDQIGTTICLGVQYIRGLVDNGYEVLYIYENPFYSPTESLLKELERLKLKKIIVDKHRNRDAINTGKSILKAISDFSPKHLIIHSPSYGSLANTLLYSLEGLTRYRVVPGDHHFYIGYKCIDLFFEFRDFGLNYAQDYRNLPTEKLCKLPYYPLIDEFVPFQGMPAVDNANVSFLIAGNSYKFQGSNFIFRLIDWILETYPNAVVYHLGTTFERINTFIKEKESHRRLISLGYRKDFVACMNNCDILINSYPFSGGLVSQTAAYLKKPIISYSPIGTRSSMRELLGVSKNVSEPVSKTSFEEIKDYIAQMINNRDFLKSEGERVNSYLQTKEKFESELKNILQYRKTNLSNYNKEIIPLNDDYYYKLQNSFKPSIIYPLIKSYGFKILIRFPQLIFPFNKQCITSVIKALVLRYK